MKGFWRVVVPSLFPVLSVLHNQHRTRCQLPNACKDGQRRRCITKTEEEIERNWIYPWLRVVCSKYGANFRSEAQLPTCSAIVDQFDAHRVPGYNQSLILHIP